jgi:deoxyribose-phosphate aldolase
LAQINSSAAEYDIVINLSKLREKKYESIREDLAVVRAFVGEKILKVIVESGVLTTEELIIAVDLVAEAKADFVKTSTGFIPQSDSELFQEVSLIQNVIKMHGLSLSIKASGGIKTIDQVKILLGLGTTRIGTSNSVRILQELRA